MRERIDELLESDSPDEDDTLEDIALSKKYTPVELQKILTEMAERLAKQSERMNQLKLCVREVLDSQKVDYQLALER